MTLTAPATGTELLKRIAHYASVMNDADTIRKAEAHDAMTKPPVGTTMAIIRGEVVFMSAYQAPAKGDFMVFMTVCTTETGEHPSYKVKRVLN